MYFYFVSCVRNVFLFCQLCFTLHFYFTGTLCVTYLVCFVITNAAKWGINVEFGDESQTLYAPGNCNVLYL